MMAYLWTTGTIFALLALMHLWRTIAEWPGSTPDLPFVIETGIGVVAAALAVWAWRLTRGAGLGRDTLPPGA
jgi:hypothetical protein